MANESKTVIIDPDRVILTDATGRSIDLDAQDFVCGLVAYARKHNGADLAAMLTGEGLLSDDQCEAWIGWIWKAAILTKLEGTHESDAIVGLTCPGCHKEIEAVVARKHGDPKNNWVCVCGGCGKPVVYDVNLKKLRLMGVEDLADFTAEEKRSVLRAMADVSHGVTRGSSSRHTPN